MDEEAKVISFYRGNPFVGMTALELERLVKFIDQCGDEVPHQVTVLRWRNTLRLIEAKRLVDRIRSRRD